MTAEVFSAKLAPVGAVVAGGVGACGFASLARSHAAVSVPEVTRGEELILVRR